MTEKTNVESGCSPENKGLGCCQVESVVSVDERGQMVLPKEIRAKAKIQAGDKLAIISWVKDDKVCCLSLIKTNDFADMVKGFLSPIMKDLI